MWNYVFMENIDVYLCNCAFVELYVGALMYLAFMCAHSFVYLFIDVLMCLFVYVLLYILMYYLMSSFVCGLMYLLIA